MTTDKVLDKLSLIDWGRYNEDWIGLLGSPDLKSPANTSGRHPVAISKGGRQTVESLYKYLTAKTGIDTLRQVSHAAE